MKSSELLSAVLIGYVCYKCGELISPWIAKQARRLRQPIRPVAGLAGQTKRALLIGCNYPNTKAELQGCHNDVKQQKQMLKEVFGFVDSEILEMLDGKSGAKLEPTKANILRELRRLVSHSQPGDILYLHFSGHGVQIPTDDSSEEDYLDEALVCSDLNVIIDDDLHDIVKHLHPSVNFTMIADCCHSGSMLDGPPAIIKGDKTRDFKVEDIAGEQVNDVSTREMEVPVIQKREIPVDMYKEMIAGQEGIKQNTRDLMREKFGDDTSDRLKEQKRSTKWKAVQESLGNKVDSSTVLKRDLLSEDAGVLITGCQDFETSADASWCGRSFGAMTNALVTVIRHHYRNYPDQDLTYETLVLLIRQLLAQQGYTQNPCLECSPARASTAFLTQK